MRLPKDSLTDDPDSDRLFALVRELNPEGVERRRGGIRKRHGYWQAPGPNYIWSIDAHLKLQPFGIEIYAAIDVFSRYIVWAYIGNSATTAVSVAAQYLNTVQDIGITPAMLMSDHGGETALIADAHLSLVRALPGQQELPFREAYRFVTSKENQRIESWWNQMSKGCTMEWRVSSSYAYPAVDLTDLHKVYFQFLRAQGLFSEAELASIIAIRFLYVPLIRIQITKFIKTWNRHRIRNQRNRPGPVGQPHQMYWRPEKFSTATNAYTQQGLRANLKKLQHLQEAFSDFSTLLASLGYSDTLTKLQIRMNFCRRPRTNGASSSCLPLDSPNSYLQRPRKLAE
jgi:hypothetical protein